MADDSKPNIFRRIQAKINALQVGRRNARAKLNKRKEEFGEKKAKLLNFISEVLITLGLVDNFIRQINDFFAKGQKYDSKFKQILIDCFNANIACNLDDIFQLNEVYTGAGSTPYFKMKISRLDFFGLFKLNPDTVLGYYLYGLPSENRLDRVIKTAIDKNIIQNWKNILYIELDPTDNTVLNFYVNGIYVNKPVNALITDLVNQINLIPKIGLLGSVMDNLYGSMGVGYQPTKIDVRSLFNKQMLTQYIEKVLDGGDDIVIDDSFFDFTNEEIANIEMLTQNISNNFLQITSCNNAESVILPNDLYPILNQLVSAGTYNEQIEIITAGMTTLENVASRNVLRVDIPKFKIEFFFNIFNQIIASLVQMVYSPQFLTLMMFYFKLANTNPGQPEPIAFTDFKDFLKKTRNIMRCIIISFFIIILVWIVIPIIIKRLIGDANRERLDRNMEKYQLYKDQYLALTNLLEKIKSAQLLQELASSV